MSKQTKRGLGVFIVAVICTCAVMRAPLTSVGATAEIIKQALDLPSTAVGLLTTIPLIAFAVCSIFMSKISARLGKTLMLLVGCVLALVGIVIRSMPGTAMLFVGTVILGVGISCGNVLIPAVIKERTPDRIGPMTSLYTTAMTAFSGTFAGISSVMAGNGVDWRLILACTIPLAIAGIVSWIIYRRFPACRDNECCVTDASDSEASRTPACAVPPTTVNAKRSIYRIPLAWWVSIAMGVQSVMFYSCIAWLPTMLAQIGMDGASISLCITLFPLLGIPCNLAVPSICSKTKNQKGFGLAFGVLLVVGFILLFTAHDTVTGIIAVVFLGLSQGAAFSLVLLFFGLRTTNGNAAAELSGMAQAVGYVLAAIGPTLLGAMFDMSGTWTSSLLLLIGLSAVYALCGWKSGDGIVK